MGEPVRVEALERFCVAALRAVGVGEGDARTTADVLVTTDTWGTFSHGTNHLPNYVNKIRAGGIDPVARPEVVAENSSSAVMDGHNALGMVSSCSAMRLALEKARAAGIAYVGVKNSTHFGAAGYYANMAVSEGMIGVAMSNADANMVAPGGRVSVIGNNPFAYAVPAGRELPILFDIALSTVAATKIFKAKKEGGTIPDNWIVDGKGRPTTTVGDWPASGSLLPMGGHKGYGFALMVEVFAAVLSGSAVTRDVKSWLHELSSPPGLGHAFLAIDVDRIMPLDAFKDRMDKMIHEIRISPAAEGSDRVYLPGEMEWRKREAALKDGIPLPDSILAALSKLSGAVGLDFQSLFA
jgi:ureidoglycolate dehydrogenase (NAD+)